MQLIEKLQGENEALRERLSRMGSAFLRVNESLDLETVLQGVGYTTAYPPVSRAGRPGSFGGRRKTKPCSNTSPSLTKPCVCETCTATRGAWAFPAFIRQCR